MLARIHVMLKPGVLDPQGVAIGRSLVHLGFAGVAGVRQGRYLEIQLTESDPARAQEQADAMCRQLLANPVIESYSVELVADARVA
jgi:phosphoribosylformylglycinamidine synthase subunit PurS